MIRITDIKVHKTTKLVQVYSGDELLLEADPEVVFELGLKRGSVLDEGEFRAAKRRSLEKQAYNKSLHYLTFKDRTRKEVTDYLKKKGFEQAVVESVLEKLKGYGFVDDARYARQYVKDKSSFSDHGRNRIATDLEKRGIPREDAQPHLDAYCDCDAQLEKAKDLVAKLDRRYEKDPYRQKRDKIGRRLQEKGYTWEVIEQALSFVEKENRDSQAYVQELEKNVRRIVEKNKKKKLDDRTFKAKVAQQLMRKGYSREEIQKALDRLETQG